MSAAARQAFLAEPHVAVFSVAEAGRGPCTVPLWYDYSPGGAILITAPPSSRKVQLLREQMKHGPARASCCVQVEALPNKYVSVEGPVEIRETDVSELQRKVAIRYLGERRADRYLESFSEGLKVEVLLALQPERWWSVDFSLLGAKPNA